MSDPVIDFPALIPKFDAILSRGLCQGLGSRDGQMCIEAAICAALDLPHGDNPVCVTTSVALFKIHLNDASWSSPQARAKGLRDLGIAQIGSKGVVDDHEFSRRLEEKTIRILIPRLFREVFPTHQQCLDAATRCEVEGSTIAAEAAWGAAEAMRQAVEAKTWARDQATWAMWAARPSGGSASAASAASAQLATKAPQDAYLVLSASLALETLRELKSPGCEWV